MSSTRVWSLEARKLWQSMLLEWSKLFVYRFNLALQVFGPIGIFFVIKYSLWTSIYQSSGEATIGGFTLEAMIAYHLWAMVTSMLQVSHGFDRLSEEIRLGRISSFLLYPFEMWEYHVSQYLARQVVHVGIAGLMVVVLRLLLADRLGLAGWQAMFSGLWLGLLAGLLWFWIIYIFALCAFWLDETWTLRVIFRIVAGFLSGKLIPLDLYPQWLVGALEYTPFPYMTFQPVLAFMGRDAEVGKATLVLLGWIAITAGLCFWVWRRGIRNYTAAGL